MLPVIQKTNEHVIEMFRKQAIGAVVSEKVF